MGFFGIPVMVTQLKFLFIDFHVYAHPNEAGSQHRFCLLYMWGFPKISGTFLEFPRIRTIYPRVYIGPKSRKLPHKLLPKMRCVSMGSMFRVWGSAFGVYIGFSGASKF